MRINQLMFQEKWNPHRIYKRIQFTGLDYVVIDNYESLKSEFAKYYYNSKRSAFAAEMRQRVFPLNGHGEVFSTLKGAYNYRWISGTQCLYGQIPAHTSSNNTDCWSGCTNNAWTNIFGW
jgi:hypothetical protein